MSERDLYLPMPEANTQRIRTLVALPFEVENHVLLNVSHIHKLLQIGGISTLRISSDNEGKRSNVVPQAAGINPDGSATASGAAADTVPTHTFGLNTDRNWDTPSFKQAVWPSLSLKLNVPEITQRILHNDEKVTESKNWAREIDKAIKLAVRTAGTKNLLKLGTKLDKFLFWALFSKDILFSISVTPYQVHLDPFVMAGRFLADGIIFTILHSITEGVERPGEGRRVSLFYGCELDRALALEVASRLKPVVRPLKT